MSLIVIASLHVQPGKRAEFDHFEQQALAIMKVHGGELVTALQPTAVHPPAEIPDEVHVISFPSHQAFEAYRADPALAALQGLRAEAIAATHLIVGKTLA